MNQELFPDAMAALKESNKGTFDEQKVVDKLYAALVEATQNKKTRAQVTRLTKQQIDWAEKFLRSKDYAVTWHVETTQPDEGPTDYRIYFTWD